MTTTTTTNQPTIHPTNQQISQTPRISLNTLSNGFNGIPRQSMQQHFRNAAGLFEGAKTKSGDRQNLLNNIIAIRNTYSSGSSGYNRPEQERTVIRITGELINRIGSGDDGTLLDLTPQQLAPRMDGVKDDLRKLHEAMGVQTPLPSSISSSTEQNDSNVYA